MRDIPGTLLPCSTSQVARHEPVIIIRIIRTVCLSLIFLASQLLAQSHSDQVHVEPRVNFRIASADAGIDTHSKAFISNVDLVLVPVTVSDQMNRVVEGLNKDNFKYSTTKNSRSFSTSRAKTCRFPWRWFSTLAAAWQAITRSNELGKQLSNC